MPRRLSGRDAGSLESRLVISPARELGVDACDLTTDPRRLLLARLGLLLGAFLVKIVTTQAQDVGQDLLAFARGLDGEGVGSTLEQEGRVDKGLVVEAQGTDDLRLTLDQAAFIEELPIAPYSTLAAARSVVPNVKMQIALPAPLLAALPPHAIALRAEAELELDPHFGLAQGDQLIVAARAGPAPQRPGDGIQQRRLAVTVVARQASQVDATEIERLLVAVAHEVGETEFEWDHGKSGTGIWSQVSHGRISFSI